MRMWIKTNNRTQTDSYNEMAFNVTHNPTNNTIGALFSCPYMAFFFIIKLLIKFFIGRQYLPKYLVLFDSNSLIK